MIDAEAKVNEFRNYSNWSGQHSSNTFATQFTTIHLELQHVAHQSTLIKFINDGNIDIQAGFTIVEFVNYIKRQPNKFATRTTTNHQEIFSGWVANFISKPTEFADAIINSYNSIEKDALLFANVTIPSIFGHFVSSEMQDFAFQFYSRIISSAPVDMIEIFITPFINSSFPFISSLWQNYDLLLDKEIIVGDLNENFAVFINSFRQAIRNLTNCQQQILQKYIKRSKSKFAHFFGNLITNSFIDSHSGYNSTNDGHPVIVLANYIMRHEKSPQMHLIISILNNCHQSLYVLPHPPELSFPLVFALTETVIIQDLVKANPDLVTIKFIPSLAINDEFRNNFDAIFVPIPTNSFLKKVAGNNIYLLFNPPKKIDLRKDEMYEQSWTKINELAKSMNMWTFQLFDDSEKLLPKFEKLRNSISYFHDPKYRQLVYSKTYNDMCDSINEFESHLARLSLNANYEALLHSFNMQLSGNYLNISLASFGAIPSRMLSTTNVLPHILMNPRAKSRAVSLNHGEFVGSLKQEEVTKIQSGPFELTRQPSPKYPFDIRKASEFNPDFENNEMKRIQSVKKMQFIKKRRKSAEFSQLESNRDFKSILSLILTQSQSSDFKFFMCIKWLDQWNLEDKQIQLMARQYSDLIGCIRAEKYLSGEFSQSIFIKKCAEKASHLEEMKKGSAILLISEISLDIFTYLEYKLTKKDSNKKPHVGAKWSKILLKVFINMKNDSFYENFMWCSKILFAYTDVKYVINQRTQGSIVYLEKAFWALLKKLSPVLSAKSNECRQYLFKL